ncbi:MAG: polysaccharide biosynthesis C-terminal domain-containing protein [Ignavibacteriales bacterium]|nr:polysaccharide biosynthesis C-terminal domain-containing protein [Ignavibacteriales bacterium]
MFVFASYFSNLILHTPDYSLVFRIFGVTIVFYAMNALLLAAINGFKEYRKYVKVNIISSLVGLAFSVILCLYFGLMGALIAAVTSQSVVFVLTLAMVARSRWFQWPALSGMFSRTVLKQLAHFSLMAIVTAIIVPVSQIFVRGFVTDFRSVNDAGLWEERTGCHPCIYMLS